MIAAIILAAGLGTRMQSDYPKVLHKVAGRSMIGHVLSIARATADMAGEPVAPIVVVGPDMPELEREVAPSVIAVQKERRGTGHAVQQAATLIPNDAKTVLVLYGDCPLVQPETLARLIKEKGDAQIGLLTFRPDDTAAYGRVILEKDCDVVRIVEHRDANDTERAVRVCNAGMYAIDATVLPQLLGMLTDKNAQKEYLLTDIVAHARGLGHRVIAVEAAADEVQGVNSRAELAKVETVAQNRLRAKAMKGGATLIDPATTYFSYDTELGRDIHIEPNVFFGVGARIGDGVTIKAFSHIEGATVASGAVIGPFARLRPGAEVGEDAHVGNFVELKNTRLGAGAKANHLTYLGDADIGAKTNVGAGTITCNYDGFLKSRTTIGTGVFVGSNSALVAPITIGDGAIIGAGSTLTHDVPPDSIVSARGERRESLGSATRFRTERQARKLARKD
ncbi:bifunctional UDP-N-acetylglucosamine diphosphorylase/glucosamine-1-phosphate N-acetyltransferase GlmU [Lacibacterium aquatile]|uniref:Bifunctional protein GlmU n=1 Tax=Lacibacterium aquatile TaxID=1168082 RepID=A0ABW5DP49_9PROT